MSTSTEVVSAGDSGAGLSLMDRLETLTIPATLSEAYPSLNPESSALEAVLENMGGEFEDIPLQRMPRIKFPTGGDTLFNVPDATNPNGVRQEREITAILVINQSRRAFWPSVKLTGDRPACFSLDGRNGEGAYGKGSQANPRGKCGRCPMSQYGTKAQLDGAHPDAAGQACKQTRLLYLLMPGNVLPYQLSVPPTSLKRLEDWLLQLGGSEISFYAVEVSLRLGRVDGENPYAELEISTKRVLDGEERKVTRVYYDALKAMLADAGVEQVVRDVASSEGVGDDGEDEGGIAFGDEPEVGGFDDVGETDTEGAYDGEAAGAARNGTRATAKA